jgi:hypothetical protein
MFPFESRKQNYGAAATPLLVVKPGGSLDVVAADQSLHARVGQRFIAIIDQLPADGPQPAA